MAFAAARVGNVASMRAARSARIPMLSARATLPARHYRLASHRLDLAAVALPARRAGNVLRSAAGLRRSFSDAPVPTLQPQQFAWEAVERAMDSIGARPCSRDLCCRSAAPLPAVNAAARQSRSTPRSRRRTTCSRGRTSPPRSSQVGLHDTRAWPRRRRPPRARGPMAHSCLQRAGSGFAVTVEAYSGVSGPDARRIITNAHVVADQKFVQARGRMSVRARDLRAERAVPRVGAAAGERNQVRGARRSRGA
jgi:hypothetical protein